MPQVVEPNRDMDIVPKALDRCSRSGATTHYATLTYSIWSCYYNDSKNNVIQTNLNINFKLAHKALSLTSVIISKTKNTLEI